MKLGAPRLPGDAFALGMLTLLQGDPGDDDDDQTPSGERMIAAAGETLFPGSPELAHAFRERFVATLAVLDHPDLSTWVRDSGAGVMRIHPALLTAAGARVNHNGRFARRWLAEEIEALAGREFADWEWPSDNDKAG